MTVLTRPALEDSPLADLHQLAAEIGLDGFRRLRKADLVDALLARSTEGLGDEAPEAAATEEEDAPRPRRPRSRRRARDADPDAAPEAEVEGEPAEVDEAPAIAEPPAAEEDDAEPTQARPRRSRGRGGRSRGGEDAAQGAPDGEPATGVVELLDNGSGLLRVGGAGSQSDEDVYISAAQVRRCELVDGDEVAGPVRPPRRSERFPSLVRIDTINGAPADEVAEGTPFDELPAVLPSQRLELGDDPTLKAIEWLAPIGRGSRAVITGASLAGKSEALRRLAGVLSGQDGLEVSLVLVGVRPEELGLALVEPAASLAFTASADQQVQAVERAVDTARRVAARGGHAVVLVDTLDGLPPAAARRALGSARALKDGGSLTVVATASAPLGGESTHIALDVLLAQTGRLPALDLVASGVLAPELLVGEDGAKAIAEARAGLLEG